MMLLLSTLTLTTSRHRASFEVSSETKRNEN